MNRLGGKSWAAFVLKPFAPALQSFFVQWNITGRYLHGLGWEKLNPSLDGFYSASVSFLNFLGLWCWAWIFIGRLNVCPSWAIMTSQILWNAFLITLKKLIYAAIDLKNQRAAVKLSSNQIFKPIFQGKMFQLSSNINESQYLWRHNAQAPGTIESIVSEVSRI